MTKAPTGDTIVRNQSWGRTAIYLILAASLVGGAAALTYKLVHTQQTQKKESTDEKR